METQASLKDPTPPGALPLPPPQAPWASTPGGGPEEAAARLGDQLLRSTMNEPGRGRAPPESPTMRPSSPESGRADPASQRARGSGYSGYTLQSAQQSWRSSANGAGQR